VVPRVTRLDPLRRVLSFLGLEFIDDVATETAEQGVCDYR
jgi:hypothetical protein